MNYGKNNNPPKKPMQIIPITTEPDARFKINDSVI